MTSNMNTSANINVKVACNGELRCFALADFNFETLSAQVAHAFGVPRAEGFTFQYVDDEGDRITMSSDIELKAAVELSQGVLRLELILKGEAQTKNAIRHCGRPKHLRHHHRAHHHGRHWMPRMNRWRRIVKLHKRLAKAGMGHAGMRHHRHRGMWAKMAMGKFAKRHLEHAAIQGGAEARSKCWRRGARIHHAKRAHRLHQAFPKADWHQLPARKCFGRRRLWRMLARDALAQRPRCALSAGPHGRFPMGMPRHRGHCGGMGMKPEMGRRHACRGRWFGKGMGMGM